MIINDEQFLAFSVKRKDKIIFDYSKKKNFTLPLITFFEQYLNPTILKIRDPSYNYAFVEEMVLNSTPGKIYSFVCDEDSAIYQFMIYDLSLEVTHIRLFKIILENNKDVYFVKDFLTGVDSRGGFMRKAEMALEQEKYIRSALILIDLDNFKKVNDSCGHQAGDLCLKQIAFKLNEICKDEIFGRYGGDEFCAFIADATKEKMDLIVAQMLDLKHSVIDRFRGTFNITVSLGISYTSEEQNSIKELLDFADRALYRSKESGKNAASEFEGETNRGKHNKSKKVIIQNLRGKSFRLFREELSFITKTNILFSVAVVIIIAIISITSVYSYSQNIGVKAREEAQNVMSDISSQVSSSISSNISSWVDQLYIAERLLNDISKDDNYENNLISTLKILEDNVSFDNMALLLESGDLYFVTQEEYNISSEEVARKVILEHEEYIGNIYLNFIGERIIFAIPYDSPNNASFVDDDGNSIVGLVGMVNITRFAELLNSTAFESRACLTLVHQLGETIVHSGVGPSALTDSANILKLYEEYGSEEELTKMEEDLYNGETGINTLTIDEPHYVYYSTIGVDDWRILIFVPSSVVAKNIMEVFFQTEIVFYFVLVAISAFIIISVAVFNHLRKKNRLLLFIDPVTDGINEKRFQIDSKKIIDHIDNPYALVFVNFHNFKFINNQLGSVEADKVLANIYRFFESKLEENELVSRVSADHFILLLLYNNEPDLRARISQIAKGMSEQLITNGLVRLVFSSGVYVMRDNLVNIVSAIDRAHIAQKTVKRDYSTDMIAFYDEKMMKTDLEEIELEQNQEAALKNKHFEVYYQLKKNILDNVWQGSEALVRWIDPEKGLISPGKFIPLFERNGFILQLDLYVFDRVCSDLRYAMDYGYKVLKTSVNLSRRHLIRENFLQNYIDIMNKYQIPPELIEFELTESMVFENETLLYSVIDEIHLIGCTCSIDDFGSGFSSLNMLKEFDFDVIKLDRKFFYGINGFDNSSKMIVKALTNLSHELGKVVVAEGIETQDQIEFLKSIKCDIVQGWYYSHVLPRDEYFELAKKDN